MWHLVAVIDWRAKFSRNFPSVCSFVVFFPSYTVSLSDRNFLFGISVYKGAMSDNEASTSTKRARLSSLELANGTRNDESSSQSDEASTSNASPTDMSSQSTTSTASADVDKAESQEAKAPPAPSKCQSGPDDCCVCLTKPELPIRLPCEHTFCFMCIKGMITGES